MVGEVITYVLGYLILLFVCVIATWLFYSIPTYIFLSRVGYDKCFLAFIPFCKWFAIAQVGEMDGSGDIIVFNNRMSRAVAGVIACVSPVACIIPVIGSLIMICINVIFLGAIFRDLFAKYDNLPISRTNVFGAFAGASSVIGIAKIFQYLNDMKHGIRLPMYVPAQRYYSQDSYMQEQPFNQRQSPMQTQPFNQQPMQTQSFNQSSTPEQPSIDLSKE